MCPRCNEAEHNKMRYACPVGGVKIATITLEKKNWHHSVKLNMCVMNNPTVPIQVNTMQKHAYRAMYNTAYNRKEKQKQPKGETVDHMNIPLSV